MVWRIDELGAKMELYQFPREDGGICYMLKLRTVILPDLPEACVSGPQNDLKFLKDFAVEANPLGIKREELRGI